MSTLPSSSSRPAAQAASRHAAWGVGLAGLLSLALAMGVGRFAFTPLLPLMVRAGQLDVGMGGWLAAANHAGYLLGALTAARLALAPQRLGLLGLAIMALGTAAMGLAGTGPLWLGLRFVAGVASAWVMVSTSAWCLARLAQLGWPAGAGVVYAGVGVGIACAGLLCWQVPASPAALWLQLGIGSLAGLGVVAALVPRASLQGAAAVAAVEPHRGAGLPRGLVLCYGVLGFGYVVPATFLPALARSVVDDPAVFGAAWPVFGLAAALSTLWAALALHRVARRRVLAGSHLLMAVGCLLPVLHLSVSTVMVAALLVGGTFMVASLAGLQEAHALAAGRPPARAMGRMTTAFAVGQLAGPALSAALLRPAGPSPAFSGLFIALAVAAGALGLSAVWLARPPSSSSSASFHS